MLKTLTHVKNNSSYLNKIDRSSPKNFLLYEISEKRFCFAMNVFSFYFYHKKHKVLSADGLSQIAKLLLFLQFFFALCG